VLIVDDDPGMREGMALSLKRAGFICDQARSGEDALNMTRPGTFDAVVTDFRMTGMDGLQLTARLKALDPSLPVLLVTAFGSLDTAKEAMRLGAFDYLSKPFSPAELVSAVKKSLRTDEKLKASNAAEAPIILTQDPALVETLALARRAADSRATILIQAESGTGKELFAKLIHSASPRRNGPFVAINCAAIPENLLESELFGYEKGAFTGATASKAGRFEQAEGGTIVLDEIGELPLALQGKLLRAIQERTIDRLGGSKPISIDVRIIALTNRDLAQEVKEGRFREDLFYRLNVIPLKLPPLRDRKGDLRLLAAHFVQRYSIENGRAVLLRSDSFLEALEQHPWPGNIRELENAMQRCVVLHSGKKFFSASDLEWLLGAETAQSIQEKYPNEDEIMASCAHEDNQPSDDHDPVPNEPDGEDAPGPEMAAQMIDPEKPLEGVPLDTPVTIPLGLPLPDLERFWLLSTLAAVDGNRTRCAQQLNIALRTVRNKINDYREHGHKIPGDRQGKEE
jgi:two-component system response regulator FlrC